MTTLEYCVKYDFVAPLNDKEFKAFQRAVKFLANFRQPYYFGAQGKNFTEKF